MTPRANEVVFKFTLQLHLFFYYFIFIILHLSFFTSIKFITFTTFLCLFRSLLSVVIVFISLTFIRVNCVHIAFERNILSSNFVSIFLPFLKYKKNTSFGFSVLSVVWWI
jgi:hypothetical protein